MNIMHRVGVDEVGRGPLAGPVYVGVCAVPEGFPMDFFDGIRDSKKMSEKKREEWVQKIEKEGDSLGICVTYGAISPQYIDAHGIATAIRSALEKALTTLAIDPEHLSISLDGGLYAGKKYPQQETIVRGDNTNPLIAAAAITAKVRRDTYMKKLDTRYPVYGFAQHKGYGTVAHRDAIRNHGISPVHRSTFCHM